MEADSGKEIAHILTPNGLPDTVLTLMAACLNILFHAIDVLPFTGRCDSGYEWALKKTC